jgi:transforming growth factor-beta-induced protein
MCAALSTLALSVHALDTIVETAQATPSLSKLVGILTSPGYGDVLSALSSPGNFTVFAPNNDAFATPPCVSPENAPLFQEVLAYHLLGERVRSTDLAEGLQFPHTLMDNGMLSSVPGGAVVSVSKSSSGVYLNFGLPNQNAKVVLADVECSNGVVHVIDQVMCFPEGTEVTAKAAGLTELVSALTKADMGYTFDAGFSFTMLAPTNKAMRAAQWRTLSKEALRAILAYHVFYRTLTDRSIRFTSTFAGNEERLGTLQQGEEVIMTKKDKRPDVGPIMFNNATVVIPNVLVANGVVHVIDEVLLPKYF